MAVSAIRRVVAGIASGLLVVGLGACASTPATSKSEQVALIQAALTGPAASTADVDHLAESLNEFAVGLYAELSAQMSDQSNLVVSPASVAQVLLLMLAATDGTTHEQLRDVLHLDLPDERLFPAVASLWADLTGGQYTLENTNWGLLKDSVPLNPDYAALVGEHLGAQVQADSFSDPQALAQRINEEVARRTHGMIRELVGSDLLADPSLFLVLLNAVYFRGDWATGFDEELTDPEPFTRADGSVVDVAMMYRSDVTSYVEADGYTAVELPYQGGASMLLILPDPDRFDEVAASLDADALAALRAELGATDYRMGRELRLPRFDVTTGAIDLKEAVRALGAPALFEGSWDWTPLQTQPERSAEVSFLRHKAAIQVDEKGTEASGATGSVLSVTRARPPGITFDRAFLLSIVDDTHDSMLFLGRIGDPQTP